MPGRPKPLEGVNTTISINESPQIGAVLHNSTKINRGI